MPAAIEITEDTGATVLRLPKRDLRGFIGYSCGAIVFTAVLIIPLGLAFFMVAGQADILWGIMAPFAVAGIICALWGVGSSMRFVIADGQVRIEEWLGPLRRVKRCRLIDMRRLTIKFLYATARLEMAPPPDDNDFVVLAIECRRRSELLCGYGYRRWQLLEAADHLSRFCSQLTTNEDRFAVSVIEEDESALFPELLEQPPTSRIELKEHEDGVTLRLPRHGASAIRSLLLVIPGAFAIFFHFGLMFLAAWPNPGFIESSSLLFGGISLVAYVWVVWGRLRRQVAFAVVGDQLLVMESGFGPSRRYHWNRNELFDVRSGIQMRSRRKHEVHELQVWFRSGKKIVFGIGRDKEELRWVATILRRALRLPVTRDELHVPEYHVTSSD